MKQSITNISKPILKPVIYSRLNVPKGEKIKPGSRIFQKFGAKIDEKTNKVVVSVVEKYDIVEQIQSYRKDTDIYYLLQKFKNGDNTALSGARNVFYEDVSEMPNSMLDMTQLLQKGEGLFNSLSDEVKEKYNLHNVKDFIDLLFSGKLQEEKIISDEEEKKKSSGDPAPVVPPEPKKGETSDNK